MRVLSYFLFAILLTAYSNFCECNEEGPKFVLWSPAFADQMGIPERCTPSGENISPELFWEGIPNGTKSFVLICRDADALPGKDVRWIMYNIPPNVTHLSEGVGRVAVLPHGAFHGINDCLHLGYDGPTPRLGNAHHYFFTIYALDEMLSLKPAISYDKLQCVMQGFIIEKATLKCFYKFTQKLRDTGPNPFTHYCDDESFMRNQPYLDNYLYYPDYYAYYRDSNLYMNSNPYVTDVQYSDGYSMMQNYPYENFYPLTGPVTEFDNHPYLYYESTPNNSQ